MATAVDASGTFVIGERTVRRLGFGAMRITGPGIWGPPQDRDEALAVLRRAVELGVTLIDTADSYGPTISEELIYEALYPYGDVTVATKAGLLRMGPAVWYPCGRPEYLRQQCELSLRRLGVESIDLFQLHRIDATVDRDEQFGLLRALLDEGKVKAVGLSEVNPEELAAAQKIVPIATVQNLYNVTNRQSEALLDVCTDQGIGFLPWSPVAAGKLTGPGSAVAAVASQLDASPAQVSIAWLLHRSDVLLPIPGTSLVSHLEENCASASLTFTTEQLTLLDGLATN